MRGPKNLPESFDKVYVGGNGIGNVPLYGPMQHQNSTEFLIGRVINFKNSKLVRVNIICGLGAVKLRSPFLFEKLEFPPKVGDQYRYTYKNNWSIHIIFSSRIDFPLTAFYGLSITPVVKIGRGSNFIGIVIGQIFGKIR